MHPKVVRVFRLVRLCGELRGRLGPLDCFAQYIIEASGRIKSRRVKLVKSHVSARRKAA